MLKKISIIFLIVQVIIFGIIFFPKNDSYYVIQIISPTEFVLNTNEKIKIKNIDTFDKKFSVKNKIYAQKFGITEEEAFIMGNLAQIWAEKLMQNREVENFKNDLIFYKYSYYLRFSKTPFCIENNELKNKVTFQKQLDAIRKTQYALLKDEKMYDIDKNNQIKDYIFIKKYHYYKLYPKKQKVNKRKYTVQNHKLTIADSNIKLILTDFTTKLKPDRNCNTDICKELLNNINSAQKTIDIAIYGYSTVPDIEKALANAIKRGVKIRLVYDVDNKNENIYPNTNDILEIIRQNVSDINSKNVNNIMHNKFYIFDDKKIITGSANLSHTDMSGFNFNNIIVLEDNYIIQLYKKEFEQLYSGNFHTEKISFNKEQNQNLQAYFSPQDKIIQNVILPMIKNAKSYIYIPVFILTDKNIIDELINAKKRGVDIKIIVDSLNAKSKYSKHKILRENGILVKAENYAGKMHAKTIIIDDEYLILGSMNFTYSGENKNDENVLVIKNKKLAMFYKEFFMYQWNKIPNRWLKAVPSAEGIYSIGSCSDGIDNNYDGLTDKEDLKCNTKN